MSGLFPLGFSFPATSLFKIDCDLLHKLLLNPEKICQLCVSSRSIKIFVF